MRAHLLFEGNLYISAYISSKFETSFRKIIKMAAGFSGMRQYFGWLILMFKVTQKLGLAFY